jgi:antitoxin HicB
MKIVEAVHGMTRTYTFVFDPDPEGGFVVTCPALPGLVTHGATLEEARMMARDAMEGYIETLIEDGEPVPESDAPQAIPRFDRLAHTLRTEKTATPIFEQLSAQIAPAV